MKYLTEKRELMGLLIQTRQARDITYDNLTTTQDIGATLLLLSELEQALALLEAGVCLKNLAGRWHRRAVLRGDMPNPTTPEENQALWCYEPKGNPCE